MVYRSGQDLTALYCKECVASATTFVRFQLLFADWLHTLQAVKDTSATFSSAESSQSVRAVFMHVCVWMGSSATPPSSWATSLSSYQIFVCPSLFICLLFALFIEIYLRQIDNISRKFATYFLCLHFVCFCVQIIHIYRVLYLRLCSCLSDNDMDISSLLLFKFVKSQ